MDLQNKIGFRLVVIVALLLFVQNISIHATERALEDSQDNGYIPPIDGPVYAVEEDNTIEGRTYTMMELASMDTAEAMQKLRTMKSAYNISDLFKMNQGTIKFYLNEDLMNALIIELEQSAKTFTVTDDKGICKYLEILRAGFYRAFYSEELGEIATWQYKERLIPALSAIVTNESFSWAEAKTENSVQDQVIYAFGAILGSGIAEKHIVEHCAELVNVFMKNAKVFMNNPSKVKTMLRLGDGIDYAICTNRYLDYHHPEKSAFYNQIPAYMAALKTLTLYGEVTQNNRKLLVHAVRWLGNHTGSMIGDDFRRSFLNQVLNKYAYCSRPWIEAVKNLDYYFEDELQAMDMNKVRKDVEAALLPNWYYFQDSTFVFNTGDNVDPKKVQLLYWAIKEVRDQFLRLVMNDQPVDGWGRKDDHLVASIYNSPEEYEYNWFLNEIDTENGGIYIEKWGRFFTWERTPSESIYTLEELFRHEFTHYLQGRYLCPGYWGESPIYQDSGLVWFEEGGAEFQAGSTRANGVSVRRSMLSRLSSNKDQRVALDSLLHSGYELGSKIYTYSYAMYRLMYEQHPEILFKLFKIINTGNIEEYKAYIKQLEQNQNLNDEYMQLIDHLMASEASYTNHLVAKDYADDIFPIKHKDLYREIKKSTGIKQISVDVQQSDLFKTFSLKGVFKLGKTQGETADRLRMDELLNQWLKNFTKLEWNGYKTITAYFKNYKIIKGKAYFEIQFNGYLPLEPKHKTTNI